MTDPAHVAACDQARAEARDFASCIGDYFNSLRGKGLERGEALELTLAYQAEKFMERRPILDEP